MENKELSLEMKEYLHKISLLNKKEEDYQKHIKKLSEDIKELENKKLDILIEKEEARLQLRKLAGIE